MATSFSLQYSILFLTFTTLSTRPAEASKPQRLVTQLIHRNSGLSPYFNPNDTLKDRAQYAEKTSAARLAFLQRKAMGGTLATIDDIRAPLDASGLTFYVNFSIGEPAIPQHCLMDTGSNLIWVHCEPCERTCFDHPGLTLDPYESSSYNNLSCFDHYCGNSIHGKCDDYKHCRYSMEYLNNAVTEGVLATERFIFETSDEGTMKLNNVVFGCSHENGADSYLDFSGLFGLGDSPVSLVTRLGNKFSYCIGSVTDPEYRYNRLMIGDGADFEGYSTPFETYKYSYYVTLEGISLGEIKIEIDPQAFRKMPWGEGGVILDSGSALTYLPEYEFSAVRSEVAKLLEGLLSEVQDKDRQWALCYRGNISRDLVGFPVMTFHLAGGADLVLEADSLFYYTKEELFCMAIAPTKTFDGFPDPPSIIGIMAQQYYNVAYDLNSHKIYFQRIDCELLDF